jgi:hypothetical protein
MNSTRTLREIQESTIIDYKGKEYVCTDTIWVEDEYAVILIATHIYLNQNNQICAGDHKICSKIHPEILHQPHPEDSIKDAVWHPIEMIKKLGDPLVKAIYE